MNDLELAEAELRARLADGLPLAEVVARMLRGGVPIIPLCWSLVEIAGLPFEQAKRLVADILARPTRATHE
ncbi:MAG TPA: hypothetical protein VKD71_11210 [Gemmataceae bacterium]|nr:hypothetical protein [Gemmataceae bacterium]